VCVVGVIVAILVVEKLLAVIGIVFESMGRLSIKVCSAVDMDDSDIVLVLVAGIGGLLEQRQKTNREQQWTKVIDQHLCRDASFFIDIERTGSHIGRIDQYVEPVEPLPFHDVRCHPPHVQEPGEIELKRPKLVQIIQQVRRLAKHSCNRFHRLCKGACADLDLSTSEGELVGNVPADIIWIVACRSNNGDFALERWKSGKFVSDGYEPLDGGGGGHIGSGEVYVRGRTMSGREYVGVINGS
jgi:hypothetical protein